MKEKIVEYFNKNREAMLDDIAKLIAIPSVKSDAVDGKPFGEQPYHALETALDIARKMGFSVNNYDGYVGTVDMNSSETELGILAHLDVVPAGDGWLTDPFNMVKDDGKIFGRGVSDDKGPAIAALYAMKAVKDLKLPISKNCRLILGTDEECGSADLKYYFSREKTPPHSFTPDAEFPVTNGEKGRFTKYFYKDIDCANDKKRIVSIDAGVAENAVPSFATATIEGVDTEEFEKAVNVSNWTGAEFEISDDRIICRGKSAHASLPENGNNPITALFELLSNINFEGETKEMIYAIKAMFPHGKYNGEAFGVNMADQIGSLTLTLDIVHFDGSHFTGCFDTRTPMKATKENCALIIADKLEKYGFHIENTDIIMPHYVDENSNFVRTLLKSYETFSNKKGGCVSMGGGTYVHDIDGGVAFGAIGCETQTNMHGANEFMIIDELIEAAEIFTSAIFEICI